MKVFITGATGFVGFHLARLLKEKGIDVTALVRKSSDHQRLQSLSIKLVYGDLLDIDSLEAAMRGCDTLFHLAAYNRFWSPKKELFYRVNCIGTKNVLDAALRLRYEKVVYCSTRGTMSAAGRGYISESSLLPPVSICDDYLKSKISAEETAQQFNKAGLPVVIVNPTAIIGPEDFQPSPIGRIVIRVLNHRLPYFYINGSLNFVDVRDVALGHFAALQYGEAGERYILGNKNIHFEDFLKMLSGIFKLNSPTVKLPYPFGVFLVYFVEKMSLLTGRPPAATVAKLRNFSGSNYCNCSKSERMLHINYTPFEDSLKAAVNWFRDNSFIQ